MLTSKEQINKYTRRFREVLPLCFEYRKNKQWTDIVSLIQEDLQKFEKLPTSLKQNIDQFIRSSLTFFLAEAQYHLKLNVSQEGLRALDSKDPKINQIKAKTYYLLYRQTGKVEHIEYACKLAQEFYGPEHRYTKLFGLELREKHKELKFQELQAIPNFEAFKEGLDYKFVSKWKMKNLPVMEKMTTEASTTSRKYRGNESILKVVDQKIQLVPHQQNSMIQFRPTPSILRDSIKLETPVEQNMTELLLPRPQLNKQKIFRRILKTQPSPAKQQHHKKESSLGQQQLNRNNLLKRSQIKQVLKTSSKQKIEIQQTTMECKSIQCEFSEPPTPIDEQPQDIEFHFSPRVGQSYYSLNTSTERSRHKIDFEYLHNRIEGIYKSQQEDALRMIIKNFRGFVQRQKTQRNQELMKKSATKQHFSTLIVEMGATKNVMIEEKISRIKQVLHICQVIDQGSLKSWMIYSPMKQVNSVCWRIRNISWVIFKRLKSKKTQMHPDIFRLYKEYPKYPQIIEIWSNSIDGTNAIFVLTLQVEIKSKCYDIRLHIKNIQHIAKDFENIFSSTEMVSQLINVYFQSQGIVYQHKNTTQYILTKQSLLRQDMLKKGCQNISNHLNQLFIQSFLYMRAENGYKFRRLTFSEQILDNQVEKYQQIEYKKQRVRKVFIPFVIGTGYFIQNSNKKQQKLLKSLSIVIESQSPALREGTSPKNYWQGLRSQSYKVSFQDEIVEESLTPKSNISSSPKSRKSNRSPKNQTFSSMSSQPMSKKKIIENFYKSYPKERNQMQKEEIPRNPYQSQQILLTYLTYQEQQWQINSLTFTFNFDNPKHFGHFLVNCTLLNDREHFQTCISLREFCFRVDLSINTIKNHIGFFRDIPYIAKLRYLQSNVLEHSKYVSRENFLFPEYKITRKIQRKSLLDEVNKDHYYIFTYKPQKQFRTLFKIKLTQFRGKDVYFLYAYKVANPIYIRIPNESLSKLQDLFKKIISQRPSIGEYQQLQSVLHYYIFKEHKAIGCCAQLGFQSQNKQVFNYELKTSQIKDIYTILLKYLVANEQNQIKNILRTYCRVTKFQVVSQLSNFKGMNLLLFTEYALQEEHIILEIHIFPFDKRLCSFKTYLNHNDLAHFEILQKPIEEKALFLKNMLCLAYNGNSQQVHLQYDGEFNYVNLLNYNMKADTSKALFIKQKQAIRLIFQKVKKLSSHFIIISLFQNMLNMNLIIQIYIPHLCKQFRSVMSDHDFKLLRPSKLDAIIPQSVLDCLDELSLPQRYNGFVEFMKLQKLHTIDDQFSIKSRLSDRSGISSISLHKYKEQYEQIQSASKTQQDNMTRSKRSMKESSKTYFGKQLHHPQRVSNNTQSKVQWLLQFLEKELV